MAYRVASQQEFEAFCRKHIFCRTCPLYYYPCSKSSLSIADMSLGEIEWATMLIDLEERTEKERSEENGDN